MKTNKDIDYYNLPIGTKHGCYTIVAGFDAYHEENGKREIAELENEKQKFIAGIKNNRYAITDIESFDQRIENEKSKKYYKVQCRCGKTSFMSISELFCKQWRDCGEDCGIYRASYPRVKADDYDIEFVNNTHESLEIIRCIDDHVEGSSIVQVRRRKGAGIVMLHKRFHCKCYLCGKEYEFLSKDFKINNDAYGSRAAWGYYCEACCDCHSISSFQWRTIKILHDHRIPYRVEVSYPDLLSDAGNPLRYDFLIYNDDGSTKCLIECQGKQHSQIGGGYGGYSDLRMRQERDSRKRKYAEKHNLVLIEIPHTIKTYDKETAFLVKAGVIPKQEK
ncbi:MAG: hypothetical protein IKJ51_01130 [Clostridia bacterium]|nr:hypothetical protein [Clostridia bacterium]MBR6810293.1 hypothetical protein [Clostridia bacterium]